MNKATHEPLLQKTYQAKGTSATHKKKMMVTVQNFEIQGTNKLEDQLLHD